MFSLLDSAAAAQPFDTWLIYRHLSHGYTKLIPILFNLLVAALTCMLRILLIVLCVMTAFKNNARDQFFIVVCFHNSLNELSQAELKT